VINQTKLAKLAQKKVQAQEFAEEEDGLGRQG
jgi:hypothetical protein